MATIVTHTDEIRQILRDIVEQTVQERLPRLVREATRKPWLTRDDLKELTDWSDRTIQHLRDTRQIPFAQHGRKILYPTEGIEQFLRDHCILPKKG